MPSAIEGQRRKNAGLCITCGKRSPVSGRVECVHCAERKKQYVKEHAEQKRQYDKQYHHEHYQKDPLLASSRSYNRRLKAQCILRGKCSRCGNNDHRVLEFDHKVDGDGTRHRKEIGTSTTALVNWIIKYQDQATGRLELLCANCHAIKHAYSRKFERYLKPQPCSLI